MADEQINNDALANRSQYQQTNQDRDEEIVQVVYQSDQHGALVGVESTSLLGAVDPGEASLSTPTAAAALENSNYEQHAGDIGADSDGPAQIVHSHDSNEAGHGQPQGMTASASSLIGSYHEQLSRAASTLPPVAEEPLSSSGGSGPLGPVEPISHENSSPMNGGTNPLPADGSAGVGVGQSEPYAFSSDSSKELAGPAQLSSFAGLMQLNDQYSDIDQTTTTTTTTTAQPQQQQPAAPIYSTIKRLARGQQQQQQQQQANYEQPHQQEQFAVDPYEATHGQQQQQQPIDAGCERNTNQQLENTKSLIDYSDEVDYQQQQQKPVTDEYEQQPVEDENCDPDKSVTRINQEIGHILTRQRAGAVEKGSFRNNFRKKLGLSVSTNENDLTAYRQKLLESSQDPNSLSVERYSDSAVATPVGNVSAGGHNQDPAGSLPSKFKRTHSVSFNVNSSRSNRHSVDIRNLPSYLTHKRASIVDVAKGAMSSIMSSLGGGGSGSGIGGGGGSGSGSAISIRERRESLAQADEEPIFEEPIAPTLSLGQRVAMVRSVGAEFGTVGWIGQFPDVDDDWIVGVIFDNMIGDCDGAYNGVRYFYSRENYAMFVPLSTLTKTDNYIGRPETGTMLSRMSVSLKPGQLISIQRSSIRLQHCFLNAPHQRVGHDVRAVSNRLHCQCHNCGPCAHLTKQQGRINALPHFGAHHLPHKSKNSLAHAAVEMLAHHHHHFHEEEEHDEKDYEFGDNAAHACNFVRYSCCPQSGARGHEFSRDCEMVRPELLDNLIHAPKAPHRRQTKPRRAPRGRRVNQQPRPCQMVGDKARQAALEGPGGNDGAPPYMGALEANSGNGADANEQQQPTDNELGNTQLVPSSVQAPDEGVGADQEDEEDGSDQSSYLSSQTSRSSRSGGGGSGSDSGSLSPRQSLDDGQPPAAPPYNFYTYDTSGFRPTGGVYNTINSQISFLDQQRFVYQRDSSAFMRSSAKPSHYSDDYYDTSTNYSEPQARREGGGRVSGSLGFKRILRCLGCLRQRGSQASGGRRRRRHRRKLSFRDRVLEYRRRQSTFVPSTLAKPHEDFASHGIMLPHSSGAGAGSGSRNPSAGNARHHQSQSRGGNGEVNSDYSSCSRSSCSSSRSNSPPNYTDTAAAAAYLNATIPMQTQDQQQQQQPTQRAHIEPNRHVGTIEHEQSSAGYPYKSGQQQQQQPRSTQDGPANNCCRPQLDYGDFTFGDGYQSYEKHELSRDSALTDLCFTDTYKSNSSSDTLKHLVDQSINAQVSLPQPLPENIDDMISPLSSASTHRLEEHGDHQRQDSPHSGQYEISSPTASVTDNANADGTDADALDDDQENLRRDLQDFSLQETNEYRHDQASS